MSGASALDVLARAAARIGAARLAPRPTGPLIVMWHGLGGSDGVPPERFEAQLERVAARRTVVPLAEAVDALGTPRAAELAALTFDDGYVDFADLALPRLASRGLHATLFVPAGHVGGSNSWDRGTADERRILDARGLRELDARFVEVGAHGWSHRRLAGLGPGELREETAAARHHLEDACGRPVRLFAYPYGQLDDFDAAAEAAVEVAGFAGACSTHFGRGSRPAERFRLRRVGIGAGDDLETVEGKLEGAYDWTSFKERLGARWRRRRAASGRR